MFTPPNVSQITKAYQGNAAPLNAKVEQDKKQNGGIPQDLRQLMAAYDIAKGKNAAGIQQALQIPTNMPTVAQNTQEQARQALQARQMQAMQEMQRKNGQPNMVPPGTSRPPMQAQGLDSLESNVGEEYAEGGIIGNVAHFDGTTGSDVKDPTEKNKSWIERFLYSNISPAERARKDALEAKAEAGRTVPTRINEERDRNMAIVNKPDPNKTQEMLERLGMATRQEQPMQQVIGQAPPAPPKADLPPKPPKPSVNAPVKPDAPAAPAAPTVAAPVVQTEAYKKLAEMMAQDPEAKAKALRDRYNREVGPRDLSIYDKTAEELQARKEKLNAPKAGYEALMDYLENIAESGGATWQDAGSGGARLRKKKQLAREAEQNTLMDKILELGGKKAEAQFGERKAMFDMTEKERDDIYKQAFDAAKSVNASDDEAKRIAAQAVENELNRKAQATENEKNRKNQLQAAAAGNRDNLMSRAQALMAADPSKKMTLEQAMQRAAEIGNAGQMESADVRRLAAYNASKAKLAEQYPEWSMPDTPKGREVRARYMQELAQARIDAGLTASGINALPSAGGPTSSNVRSQADSIIAGGR